MYYIQFCAQRFLLPGLGLALSLKAERHLERLLAEKAAGMRTSGSSTNNHGQSGENREKRSSTGSHSGNTGSASGHTPPQHGLQYQNHEGTDSVIWGTPNAPHPSSGLIGEEDLEEKALALAIEETWEESGKKWRPWAANGRATRIGEIVLLVDSDTVVPEDCLRDAAREMAACPTVAIIQHESGMCFPAFGLCALADAVM